MTGESMAEHPVASLRGLPVFLGEQGAAVHCRIDFVGPLRGFRHLTHHPTCSAASKDEMAAENCLPRW
jgi:hypothetical protein